VRYQGISAPAWGRQLPIIEIVISSVTQQKKNFFSLIGAAARPRCGRAVPSRYPIHRRTVRGAPTFCFFPLLRRSIFPHLEKRLPARRLRSPRANAGRVLACMQTSCSPSLAAARKPERTCAEKFVIKENFSPPATATSVARREPETTVLWSSWPGRAKGWLPSPPIHHSNTTSCTRPSPPICVWPPACGVDSSAADDWIHTPLSSPTPRQFSHAPRSSSHRLLRSSAGLHQTGYARGSDGEACPRPISDGRAGPIAFGRPD